MICPCCREEDFLKQSPFDSSLFGCSNCHSSYSKPFLEGWNVGWFEETRPSKVYHFCAIRPVAENAFYCFDGVLTTTDDPASEGGYDRIKQRVAEYMNLPCTGRDIVLYSFSLIEGRE